MSIKASSHLMEHIGGQAVVLMLSTTTKTHTFSQTNNSPLPFFFCYNAMFRLLLLISDQGYTSLPKSDEIESGQIVLEILPSRGR